MGMLAGKLPENETETMNGFNTVDVGRCSRGFEYKIEVVVSDMVVLETVGFLLDLENFACNSEAAFDAQTCSSPVF